MSRHEMNPDDPEENENKAENHQYPLGSKRMRLDCQDSFPARNASSDESRSNTPDSMLFRDIQNPNETNRCAVGINHYDDPTEENILQWQENQIARCITENTVNRMVESYIDLFNDDSIRLEQSTIQMAIRMAIHEHGLQQNNLTDNSEVAQPGQGSARDPAESPSSVDRSQREDNTLPSTSTTSAPSSSAVEVSNPSSVPTTFASLIYNDLEVVEDYVYDDYSDDSDSNSDHCIFLETAVAAAIQKKGLEMVQNPNTD